MQGIAHHGADDRQGGAQARRRSGRDPPDQRARRARRRSGPPARRQASQYATSAFVKEALDKGAELFNWDERKARSGKRSGTKVRGVGVAVSAYRRRLGRLRRTVRHQAGRPDRRSSRASAISARSRSSTCTASPPKCSACPGRSATSPGATPRKNLPWTCVSGGSQTTHAMTRAAHAAAMDANKKLQEIAAKALGGKPEDYEVANERVFRKGGGAGMTLAQAAQRAIELGGKYDGHELPEDINAFTKASVGSAGRTGTDGVGEGQVPARRPVVFLRRGLRRSRSGRRNRQVPHPRLSGRRRRRHGDPSARLGGQILGGSMLGIGHAHRPEVGLRPALRRARWRGGSTRTSRRRFSTCRSKMQWAAVDIPDPETPVGARGIGEPPVGGGCCAILNAISDALGDEIFRRAPVHARHDSDVARSRAADAGSADAHL